MLSVQEVEHVAKLARLTLTDEEKTTYREQLAKIIDYFDQLKDIDTSGIEPMAHALPVVNVMREDEVVVPGDRELLLKSAPETENGYFKVPKISE